MLFRLILLRCGVAQRWHGPLHLPLKGQNLNCGFTARESTLDVLSKASSSFKSAVSGSSMTWENHPRCAGCQLLWHLWMHINELKSC